MNDHSFLIRMGSRIAQRRKELHMTQEELAEQIGVSLQTVSCIELGKKAVRPENLANLCTKLDISADYVLYGKRDTQQMNDTIARLSKLGQDEYLAVRRLIELLSKK